METFVRERVRCESNEAMPVGGRGGWSSRGNLVAGEGDAAGCWNDVEAEAEDLKGATTSTLGSKITASGEP